MVTLSVNVNKVALLRNARGEDTPNLLYFVQQLIAQGVKSITVHPRPDERHIRFADVYELSEFLKPRDIELNIEGYPSEHFLQLITEVQPTQVTLVPDPPNVLTSNTGWDTRKYFTFLKNVLNYLKQNVPNTRISMFMNCDNSLIKKSKELGADRIELYTGPYAKYYPYNPHLAILPYQEAAKLAEMLNLDLNAGHDLNLENLHFFAKTISNLKEVSIGHALISDCLFFGLQNTIQKYLNSLNIV